MKVLEIIMICVYLAINFLTSKVMTAKSMKKSFVDGQCFVGKICANIFYAPAWLLKGIKIAVVQAIA